MTIGRLPSPRLGLGAVSSRAARSSTTSTRITQEGGTSRSRQGQHQEYQQRQGDHRGQHQGLQVRQTQDAPPGPGYLGAGGGTGSSPVVDEQQAQANAIASSCALQQEGLPSYWREFAWCVGFKAFCSLAPGLRSPTLTWAFQRASEMAPPSQILPTDRVEKYEVTYLFRYPKLRLDVDQAPPASSSSSLLRGVRGTGSSDRANAVSTASAESHRSTSPPARLDPPTEGRGEWIWPKGTVTLFEQGGGQRQGPRGTSSSGREASSSRTRTRGFSDASDDTMRNSPPDDDQGPRGRSGREEMSSSTRSPSQGTLREIRAEQERHKAYRVALQQYLQRNPTKKVILYVHGGAFVGASAASVRFWTYNWARETGSVIFAVDYRKPPFGNVGLHDSAADVYEGAWQSYLLTSLQIPPHRIVLWADSAGGALLVWMLGKMADQRSIDGEEDNSEPRFHLRVNSEDMMVDGIGSGDEGPMLLPGGNGVGGAHQGEGGDGNETTAGSSSSSTTEVVPRPDTPHPQAASARRTSGSFREFIDTSNILPPPIFEGPNDLVAPDHGAALNNLEGGAQQEASIFNATTPSTNSNTAQDTPLSPERRGLPAGVVLISPWLNIEQVGEDSVLFSDEQHPNFRTNAAKGLDVFAPSMLVEAARAAQGGTIVDSTPTGYAEGQITSQPSSLSTPSSLISPSQPSTTLSLSPTSGPTPRSSRPDSPITRRVLRTRRAALLRAAAVAPEEAGTLDPEDVDVEEDPITKAELIAQRLSRLPWLFQLGGKELLLDDGVDFWRKMRLANPSGASQYRLEVYDATHAHTPFMLGLHHALSKAALHRAMHFVDNLQ
ncbi:unnamed protein product [Amoebophrya sp. A25]|nr:unnamed protein product [Amoebophrya sp. A25]|eukprot:GSA25T00012668001.1